MTSSFRAVPLMLFSAALCVMATLQPTLAKADTLSRQPLASWGTIIIERGHFTDTVSDTTSRQPLASFGTIIIERGH
jgi:hypothetical protein